MLGSVEAVSTDPELASGETSVEFTVDDAADAGSGETPTEAADGALQSLTSAELSSTTHLPADEAELSSTTHLPADEAAHTVPVYKMFIRMISDE